MVSRVLFIFSGKKKHCVVYLTVNRGWHVLLLSYYFLGKNALLSTELISGNLISTNEFFLGDT